MVSAAGSEEGVSGRKINFVGDPGIDVRACIFASGVDMSLSWYSPTVFVVSLLVGLVIV